MRIFGSSDYSDDVGSVSISDLMAGLMLMFMFIAIIYMLHANEERRRMKLVAITYRELQKSLYDDLLEEFKNDLGRWDAQIIKSTLTVRFKEPEVLFSQGSSEVSQRFKAILRDFFPRYMAVLYNDKYRNSIAEIRIEGHTSSEWYGNTSEEQSYFYNMKLSQDRTRNVLLYCMSTNIASDSRIWARSYITANGLSSSKLIIYNGVEDRKASRRVEFRVLTNAEERIARILEIDLD